MEVSAILTGVVYYLLTGVVYYPLVTSASLTKEICGMLEIVSQDGNEVVIMGDFNTNMLSSKARHFQLLTTSYQCNLRQLVTKPTRITCNSRTLIDLLFVSHPENFERTGCVEALDHTLRTLKGQAVWKHWIVTT